MFLSHLLLSLLALNYVGYPLRFDPTHPIFVTAKSLFVTQRFPKFHASGPALWPFARPKNIFVTRAKKIKCQK
jgi:hypothetical protein